MANSNQGLPPLTNKFFDIVPASKTLPTPSSRPIIVSNRPVQDGSTITQESNNSINSRAEANQEISVDDDINNQVIQPPKMPKSSPEDNFSTPPAQEITTNNYVEPMPALQANLSNDELLLPEHATADELNQSNVVVDHQASKKLFWGRNWPRITLITVIVVALVVLYWLIFKSNSVGILHPNS